jgi:hypothetical protein
MSRIPAHILIRLIALPRAAPTGRLARRQFGHSACRHLPARRTLCRKCGTGAARGSSSCHARSATAASPPAAVAHELQRQWMPTALAQALHDAWSKRRAR